MTVNRPDLETKLISYICDICEIYTHTQDTITRYRQKNDLLFYDILRKQPKNRTYTVCLQK